jgi:hypothetical protein
VAHTNGIVSQNFLSNVAPSLPPASSGFAFGVMQGPRTAVGGLVGGTLLSIPFGAMMQAGYWLEDYARQQAKELVEVEVEKKD